MSRFFATFFTLALIFSSVPAFAQTTTPDATDRPFVPSPQGGAATGPLNCFDWYTFGSVQADLQPTLAQTVPGTTLTFSGEVKNANAYPLLDGTLYVKIFKRDETTFAEGDGNIVVDQFVVKDGITLPAKGTLPVQYDWKVPMNAEGGEYYAAYFFTTADRYNLMGLSFTDDVVGNQAPFTITAENKTAKLSKIDTTLNARDHHFAAFPLHFAAGDTVTVKTTITNPSDTPKTLPLQWNQYAWDAMNEDNLRFTKTEVVTLAPNETKEVSYEIQAQRESVVYVTAITQDNEAKSILNIRYVRDGIEETRINFPGLATFPLQKDTETTLFACAHSTNLPVVSGNTLTLTLKDRDNNVIHEYKYDGDISGAMAGFGEVFKPTKNINYAVLTATLERNGVTVEQVTQTFDCTVIDPNSCLPEDQEGGGSLFDMLTHNTLTIIITLFVLTVIGAIVVAFIKKRHSHSDAGPTMTTPTAMVFFLLLLPSLFFVQSGVVEAKSASWNQSFAESYLYKWNNGGNPIFAGAYGYQQGLANPNVSVTYNAQMYNADSGALITDGATVPVGTKVRFDTPLQNSDISWFGTGYSGDSPNGRWVAGAGAPSVGCNAQDYVGDVYAGKICIASHEEYYYDGFSGYTQTICDQEVDSFYGVYIPLSINPPNISVSGPGLSNLGGGVYQITSAGTFTVAVDFSGTYGHYYYRYTDGRDYANNPCVYNDDPLASSVSGGTYYDGFSGLPAFYSGGTGNTYTLSVPSRQITFTLTAVSSNNTPTAPTVSGPVQCVAGTAHNWTFTGTDPDGDQVKYYVDWNGDGSIDQGNPYDVPVNSGQSVVMTYTYGAPGTYTLKALTQDVKGANSAWTTITVSCIAQPVPTADLTINGSNGPIDVPKNTTINLNWSSANAASCTKWGGSWGSGEAIPLTGNGTTVVTATTNYLVNCGGVTDTVTVNVVNQTPAAPAISYVSGTRETGQTLTFSIQGADPDSDNVFYEIDWDNNGTVDATTMTVPSNTAQNANRSWSTVGVVTFQARTVDTAGARSGWTSHSETLSAPPPPTTTFEVQVGSGGWTTSSPTGIDTNDTVTLRWSSTGATSCTGTNFNTGNATSNSGTTVTTPAPGGSTTFTLACTGAGGTDSKSITVQVGLPNFNRPIATHNLSTTFNPATGEYNYVDVSFQTTNDGQSGTKSTAPYSVQFDSRSPVTGSIPLLTRGSASPNFTHRINTIPFGNHTATIIVDTNNSVTETNEGDNTYVYNFGGIIPPPNPGLNITADRVQLRNSESTVIRWSTVATYPTLECMVQGPGMNIDPAPLTGNRGTQPITAKSEYTFSCTETTTNTTWSDSVMVETQGVIEEI